MQSPTVRDKMLGILAKGPIDQAQLRESITKDGAYTPQAFYKALRQLRKEEVITPDKKTASLSFFWIQNELDRISRIASIYHAPVYQSYFGALKEGESISYRFKTLRELEVFWVHSVLTTVESSEDKTPIMSLTPHDWFQHLRPDINVWWRRTTTGHPHWAVLTHATTQEMKRTQYPDVKQFERMAGVNPLKQKESVYINAVGDLIFEARFDEPVLPKIRDFMEGTETNPDPILDLKGSYRLTIERNPRKEKMIRNKLKKYFSISQD